MPRLDTKHVSNIYMSHHYHHYRFMGRLTSLPGVHGERIGGLVLVRQGERQSWSVTCANSRLGA